MPIFWAIERPEHMPLMRAGTQLIYYAHVPKCAGSAVEHYLKDRFGSLAFIDTSYLSQTNPWTQTSPQHIDRFAFGRLFPQGFVDATFAIVRHPTARLVSAWHFQSEVEKSVPDGLTFSDWLKTLKEGWETNPYGFDNHTRPMDDIVPSNAYVFHLEHGLEGIIPWLDRLTGVEEGPKAIAEVNKRGAHSKVAAGKVAPTDSDLQLIHDLYRVDFERFGYQIESKTSQFETAGLRPSLRPDQEPVKRESTFKKLIAKATRSS